LTERGGNGLNRSVSNSGSSTVHLRHAALLILLCLTLYLPGLSAIPPLDRDEARFAQASKQMVETRDYVDIRFQETPRYKKPVGAYWLQAASAQILSPDDPHAIWAYRVPSVIAAIVAVLLTYALALLFLTEAVALLAAALLASSFLLTAEAHMAKTDAGDGAGRAIWFGTGLLWRTRPSDLGGFLARHWVRPVDQRTSSATGRRPYRTHLGDCRSPGQMAAASQAVDRSAVSLSYRHTLDCRGSAAIRRCFPPKFDRW
jgi:hypothetical protein